MSERKLRLRILGMGGTWCMPEPGGSEHMAAEVLGDNFDFDAQFPEVRTFCTPTFHELFALDSTNLSQAHWHEVADYIGQNEADYDAFVVLQGTDTLSFTAASLAFALQGLGKPVILSGAQLSKEAVASDASQNVVNACRVAMLSEDVDHAPGPVLREVAVVFGSRIIRATRCRKYSERDLEAFDTVNVPLLGRIRLKIRINSAMMLGDDSKQTRPPFRPAARFDDGVALLHIFPGMSPKLLETIGRKCTGLVLAAYGAGNVPCSTESYRNTLGLESAISALVQGGTPIVVTTQCVTGQAEVGRYETGNTAQEAGAIIANDITPETAYVKLSWLLANEDRWPRKARQAARGGPGRIGAIRTAMLTEMAGEVTENADLRSVMGV